MTGATLEEGFEEACRALGESIVRERLVTKHLAEVQATNADLLRQLREVQT